MMKQHPLSGIGPAASKFSLKSLLGPGRGPVAAGAVGFGLPIAANFVASQVPENYETSSDDVMRGALQWGGVGAGLGSIIPGIGTAAGMAIGGGLGAAVGGVKGFFDSSGQEGRDAVADELARNVSTLNTTFDRLGVPESGRQALMDALQTQVAMGANTRNDVRAIFQNAAMQAPQLIAEARRQSRLAGIQAAILPMMRSASASSEREALMSAGYLNAAASRQTDPMLADLARAQASQIMANQYAATNAAYGQIAAIPTLQEALGAGTGMGAGMGMGTGTTGSDYAALMAQLQPTG
jgi:hypothetical protein